jgi:tetratricopeptide (TPR) repeat protein
MFKLTERVRTLSICGVLIGITVVVYWGVWKFDFLSYDDAEYINKNIHVVDGLTWSNVQWAISSNYSNNWHPLTWWSHMLDVQLFGLKPGAHHAINLLFHLANTVLLFLLLKRMMSAIWPSAFVAALFAIHPLHVQSVAWLAERKDVLSGFFFFLTLWAYTRYSEIQKSATGVGKAATAPRRGARGWYVFSLVLFACGLMAKPMLVTVPFLLLLLDVWPLGRAKDFPLSPELAKPWQNLVLEKIPFLVLCVVSCSMTMDAQKFAMVGMPLEVRIENAVLACVDYLKQTFWPTHLAVFYPYPTSFSFVEVALVGAGLLAVTIASFSRQRFATVGWLWYLGMLVPVLGIVQVGSQSRADRYTYLPLIGIFIMIAWGLQLAANRMRQIATLISVAAVIAVLGLSAVAYKQVRYWKDSDAVFSHAIQVTKDNYVALGALGMSELWRGNYDKAMALLSDAMKASEHYAATEGIKYYIGVALQMQGKLLDALPWLEQAQVTRELQPDRDFRLGMSLAVAKRFPEAESAMESAIVARPDNLDFRLGYAEMLIKKGDLEHAELMYTRLVEALPNSARVHKAYGDFLIGIRKPADAAAHYAKALEVHPNPVLRLDYGTALNEAGQPAQAKEQLREFLKAYPTNSAANFQLADCLEALGQHKEAVLHYERVLESAPTNVNCLNNLAWILATCADENVRDGHRAVEFAKKACNLTEWKEAFLLGTLAAAFAETGDFGNAVTNAEKAVGLAKEQKTSNVAQRNEELLALYRVGKPYHETK